MELCIGVGRCLLHAATDRGSFASPMKLAGDHPFLPCPVDVWWMSDGCTCQMGVRFVTAQSTRHMHYIMTCLSGDCVVLVTITVTTNLCTKETLCSPGVGCVRASLDYGARDTLDCTLVISTVCALRMRATALLDA